MRAPSERCARRDSQSGIIARLVRLLRRWFDEAPAAQDWLPVAGVRPEPIPVRVDEREHFR